MTKYRNRKKKKGRMVVHKSDKITPAAVQMRRELATMLTDGPMPPFLCHMNIGQMEELRTDVELLVSELNAGIGDIITGNMLAMNEGMYRAAMVIARKKYVASVTATATRFMDYNEYGCPVHTKPPVLDWH